MHVGNCGGSIHAESNLSLSLSIRRSCREYTDARRVEMQLRRAMCLVKAS